MTRAVNVEALKPWSMVSIWYCSTARATSGSGRSPRQHPQVVVAVAEVGVGVDGVQPLAQAVQGHDERRHRRADAAGRWTAALRAAMSSHGRKPWLWPTSDTALRSWSMSGPPDAAMLGQQPTHRRRGRCAAAAHLVGERPALGRRRQVALEQQEPHVLQRALVGQLDRRVLAVVVEALEAADVADLRLGDDHALEPGGASIWPGMDDRLDRGDAHQVAHRDDADQLAALDHRDVAVAVLGRAWRAPPGPAGRARRRRARRSSTRRPSWPADGGPAAASRTMSRSVRMPIGRLPSTTTTEPTPGSLMRAAATAMVSSGSAVTTGELMTSATVRTCAASRRIVDSASAAGRRDAAP